MENEIKKLIKKWNKDYRIIQSFDNACEEIEEDLKFILEFKQKNLMPKKTVEIVAKYLVSQFWVGVETGINNSCTRNISEVEYYELNKKEWLLKASALLHALEGGEK